jgi:crotonobetainyl-CoA:carnitine CoA-transferase CaiB-like acyl-CoA transferase
MEVDTPAGPVTMTRPPVSFGGCDQTPAIPHLGQHTESVLRELGFANDRIDALRMSGAI